MTEQLALFGLTEFETWTRNVLINHPTSQTDVLSEFAIMQQNAKAFSYRTPVDVLAAIKRLVELGEVAIDGRVIRRINDASD